MIANTSFLALAAQARGRDNLTTEEAALALNRKPQTLRKWACQDNGPIRPVRVHGRLAWPVAEVARLLSGLPADRPFRRRALDKVMGAAQ